MTAVMTERLPLYYTFGNHMHWVDMQWLWGYDVLTDSIRDMLHLCNSTGAKGNINFDGIGYEKLAAEAPDALNELRKAIKSGQIEVVGGSYGQPYGLFHGSESNIRQRVYGVRAVKRLLGVRPRTFWEEEFDFFPQLPQMLRGVGYEYASLFFQWTWHTPEVPKEKLPAVWWEGQDGSRLLAAPRSNLNVHQWPEDFDGLLESPLLKEMPTPGIVQWLELMPSPDWMCRSELLLPRLHALIDDPRFDIRFGTLSEYLEAAREHAEPRQYTMDDVFHGMSLGKNGDYMRRQSRETEQLLLAAESLSAMMALFGRPYPHWDAYPTWELEEAWRELLSAQHHDNDECEGLCGHVGKFSYERSRQLSGHVIERSMQLLADRTSGKVGRTVIYNPLGWERNAVISSEDGSRVVSLPPFGYRVIDDLTTLPDPSPPQVVEDDRTITLQSGALKITVDRERGVIRQITSRNFPDGLLPAGCPLLQFDMMRGGLLDRFERVEVEVKDAQISIRRYSAEGTALEITVNLAPECDAVDIHFSAHDLPRPDAGMHTALQTIIGVNLPDFRLVHDHPYGLSEICAEGIYRRKYPTGHWMTSPQVFETIHHPFNALSLLDFDDGERGLLYLHDGSQAFFRNGSTIRNILSMYDPWDEDYFVRELDARVRLVPHGRITHAERWKLAQEFTRPALVAHSNKAGGTLPPVFGSVWSEAPGAAVSALYREASSISGAGFAQYVDLELPYILRCVEFNGEATKARVMLPGPVGAVYKTNLLGEVIEKIDVQRAVMPPLPEPSEWSEFEISLRPYEIATLYVDLVYGRKAPRNLDDYRHVWATVHRINDAD